MPTMLSRRSLLAALAAGWQLSAVELQAIVGPETYVVILTGKSKRRPHGEPRVAYVTNDEPHAERLAAGLNRVPHRHAQVVRLAKGGAL